ncbi:MAG: DUF4163 domain-containing protein [Leptolyngbya sp. SIO1D8]|nr:DUF4163 domain-containing protein [Leptolyngbya sp. SIO1D8]
MWAIATMTLPLSRNLMRKRSLNFLSNLLIATIFLSCYSNAHDIHAHDTDETAQTTLSPFISFGIEIGKWPTFLSESREEAISTKDESDRFSANLSLISDDLVIDNRQLLLSHNAEIFESANETCLLTFRYPQVSGMKNQVLEREINEDLRQEIRDLTIFSL